jgi:hypothetical protein
VSPRIDAQKDCVSLGGIPTGTLAPPPQRTEGARSCVSSRDRCAEDCASLLVACRPAPAPVVFTGTPASLATHFPPARLLHAGGREARWQRIAHRYRWHAVRLPRRCLHGNSPSLLQPILLLVACCTQEDAKLGEQSPSRFRNCCRVHTASPPMSSFLPTSKPGKLRVFYSGTDS